MKAHEEKIQARENLVRSLAGKHGLKGYDHSPLEEDRVSEFELKLKDIHHRKTTEYEKLAAAGTAKIDSMSRQLVDLTSQQTQYKMERGNIRQSIVRAFLTILLSLGSVASSCALVVNNRASSRKRSPQTRIAWTETA